MKSKPIIFNGESVRAILAGRKTQTRRVAKPQNIFACDAIYRFDVADQILRCNRCGSWVAKMDDRTPFLPPYLPDDVLWVREVYKPDYHKNGAYLYKADAAVEVYPNNLIAWFSPIYMPRAAARIFLRVTDVRAERVQSITYGDCCAEGVFDAEQLRSCFDGSVATEKYRELWNSLNDKHGYGWDMNPWVWVYEFERTEKPK